MLTNKAKYALKAMSYIAQFSNHELIPGQSIAVSQNISKKFLDTILTELISGGFIFSKKGFKGGYALAKDPKDITLAQIIRYIDGPLAPIQCASKTRYRPCDDCEDEKTCPVRKVMQEAQKALSSLLDGIILNEMNDLSFLNLRSEPDKSLVKNKNNNRI